MNIQGVYSVTSGDFAARLNSNVNIAEKPEKITENSKVINTQNTQKFEKIEAFFKREEQLSSAYKSIGMGNYVNFSA